MASGSSSPSREERQALGRAARQRAPRSSHAELSLPAGRDPVGVLAAQSTNRVPDLVPIRYGRMLASPFAFYRGAAAVMAADLAGSPVSGISVQLCGDAHLSNFGFFASPERQLVFDLNDFDETLRGPWEWDVKRLAASLVVAAREEGLTDAQRAEVVLRGLLAYREAMSAFAASTNLEVWYARLPAETLLKRIQVELDAQRAKVARRRLAKFQSRDSVRAYGRFVEVGEGRPRIRSEPPLLVPLRDVAGDLDPAAQEQWLVEVMQAYRSSLSVEHRALLDQFTLVDGALKVVGVGSVGTRCWIALFVGADVNEPLFLQVKEAGASVLEPYLGAHATSSAGERVVTGQRLMQAASDIFLGWQRVRGLDGVERDFYVRQLYDWKGSVTLEALSPRGLALYAELCGWTLARAHARSGDRIAIAGYLGRGDRFDRAVAVWAEAYADRNDADFAALAAAARDGRIHAEPPPEEH